MIILNYINFLKESLDSKLAIIITGEGFQDDELLRPISYLEEHGYKVIIAGTNIGIAKAYNSNKSIKIESKVSDLNPNHYDILVIPGGKAPGIIRKDESVIEFIKDFYNTGKKIAAICHGPQLLVTADIVGGVDMTCYPDMSGELIDAGANYIDKNIVVDSQFITSRNPDDLDVFCREIIK